jgi:hypothetical protein
MHSKIVGVLAALALLGAGGAAAAQSAAPLSLANGPAITRAGGGVVGASDLRGGRWVLAAAVAALVIWGAIELLGDNDEAFPTSP